MCTLVHLGGGGDTGLTLGGIYMGLLRAGFRFCRHSPFRMFNRDSSPFPLFLLLPSSLLDLPVTAPAVCLGADTVHCLFVPGLLGRLTGLAELMPHDIPKFLSWHDWRWSCRAGAQGLALFLFSGRVGFVLPSSVLAFSVCEMF